MTKFSFWVNPSRLKTGWSQSWEETQHLIPSGQCSSREHNLLDLRWECIRDPSKPLRFLWEIFSAAVSRDSLHLTTESPNCVLLVCFACASRKKV